MRLLSRTMPTKLAAAVTALSVLLVPAMMSSADAKPIHPDDPVTVMSRNIYLGADIQRPVTAATLAQMAPGATPQSVLVALANATHETRRIVDTTAFGVRAKLLAAEIADTQPDLVGLQEVALWRSGDLQLAPAQVGVPNAEHVDYDYLEILLDELSSAGVEYEAVNVAERADVEAPSFLGSPFDASIHGVVRDVRMTMRDVILMRVGSGLVETGEGQAPYTNNLEVTIAGKPMNFTRGYNWVDVRHGAKKLRFINTHLEAFSSDLAYAQAQELLTGPADNPKTTILVCDCNSDPENDSVKGPPVNDTLPHKAAYELLTGPDGLTDQWLEWAPGDEGSTAGLRERLDDLNANRIDHRIDLILVRTPSGKPLDVTAGEITGDEVADRDPATGLWPSDHAGVVLTMSGKG